jgi:hypothetical protein
MMPYMESKRIPTDINFRDLLKTPNKDFRKSNLSFIPSEGYDSEQSQEARNSKLRLPKIEKSKTDFYITRE